MPETNNSAPADVDIIDLREVLFTFWKDRKYIYIIVGSFILLGLLVSWTSPVEYTAEASFLPESGSKVSNLFQRYSGLFGVNANESSGGAISPSLYPKILTSLPYQVELMNEKVRFSSMDSSVTLHHYFQEIYDPNKSILYYLQRYTIGLPGVLYGGIKSIFTSSTASSAPGPPLIREINRDSVITISGEQMGTIGQLKGRIEVSTEESSIITFTARMPDPRAAAELGRHGTNLLKEYVREYRTQKAKNELAFVRQQVEEAEGRFQDAQNKLAEFRDSNLNLATAKAKTRLQELESEYELTFGLYNTLVQKLEQTKLSLQEDTPVFSTVEPYVIPRSNSSPNVKIIMFIHVFIGLIISILFVIGRQQWIDFRQFVSHKKNT